MSFPRALAKAVPGDDFRDPDRRGPTDTRRFVRRLWIGIALLNVFVAGLAGQALYSSWRNAIEGARADTQNLSTSLERELAGIFDNIDMTLNSLVDSHASMLRTGSFSLDDWNAELRRKRSRLPILSGMRGVDATGAVIHGLDKGDPKGARIADREYFIAQRDKPDAGLVISRPVQSRVTDKWAIVLSRRLNDRDGKFAGLVAATIPLERFSERFAAITLGQQGSIALRDGELRLIIRHPELPEGGEFGSTRIATDFTAELQRDRNAGNYKAGATSIDGVQRYHSYRRNAAHDFYINVGIAEDDYLAAWYSELLRTLALIGLFSGLSGIFARRLQRAWQRQQASAGELDASRADFQSLADDAPYGVALLEADGHFAYLNAEFTRMLGYARQDLPDAAAWWQKAYPDPAYRQMVMDAWQQLVIELGSSATVERSFRVSRSDGVMRDVRFMVVNMSGGRIMVSLEDITERLRAEIALRESREQFRTVVEESPLSMALVCMDGTIEYINRKAVETFGYLPPDIPDMDRWWRLAYPDEAYRAETMALWMGLAGDALANHRPIEPREYSITCKDGSVKTAAIFGVWIADKLLVIFEDVTERRKAEEEIRKLAYFDSLTRLPNRRLMMDRLGHALISSSRTQEFGALMILDLDNFKTLNDTRGHDAGDRLLVEVARRIEAVVRQEDTVSRFGGDEYVVMIEGLGPEETPAASQAGVIAEKIRTALIEPYAITDDGQLHHSTPSIGVVLFRGNDLSIEVLLKQADVALYQAKGAGRNAIRFFNTRMQEALDSRSAMEAALRKGLQQGELHLYYQCQIDQDGRRIGAEALLRWLPEGRPPVSPAQFIPLAEDSGLILPIGLWVLQTACAQLKAWAASTLTRDLQIAVNVSARQFRQPDFVEQVRDSLEQSGADPARLKLELTESVVLDNVEETIARMRQIKALGVTFSLDDFGTGFSSLSYLKRLPLDQVKIDQSFVRDVTSDPNDAAIVRAIIAMSQSLGMEVIAEGVETEAQLEFLRNSGCRNYQGYLFGRPVPIGEWDAKR